MHLNAFECSSMRAMCTNYVHADRMSVPVGCEREAVQLICESIGVGGWECRLVCTHVKGSPLRDLRLQLWVDFEHELSAQSLQRMG